MPSEEGAGFTIHGCCSFSGHMVSLLNTEPAQPRGLWFILLPLVGVRPCPSYLGLSPRPGGNHCLSSQSHFFLLEQHTDQGGSIPGCQNQPILPKPLDTRTLNTRLDESYWGAPLWDSCCLFLAPGFEWDLLRSLKHNSIV